MNPPLNDASRFPKKSPKWLWLLLAALAVAAIFDVYFFYRSRNGDFSNRGTLDGHEYVDLGLSVKWATCNIGADSPEEFGYYFAWGETVPKEVYNGENYVYFSNHRENYVPSDEIPALVIVEKDVTVSKYNLLEEYGLIDNKSSLDPEDDAARVNWGDNWRMPTKEEFEELVKYCSWKWIKRRGKWGYLVTSKTNNESIFLPAAGSGSGDFEDVCTGRYWTSNLLYQDPSCAHSCFFANSEDIDNGVGASCRESGLSIRPVSYADTEIEEIPFQLVEQKPSFNGGDANEFSKWVNTQLIYPEIAIENEVEGRVTLQFTVEADGRVTNVKVLRSVDESLDKEAVRVVSSSPKWKPGNHQGRPVRVTYTFPIDFQLR